MSIEYYPSSEVDKYPKLRDQLLTLIGQYLGWKNLDSVFVSDGSSFWDFGLTELQLKEISEKLEIDVSDFYYLKDVVLEMHLKEKMDKTQ